MTNSDLANRFVDSVAYEIRLANTADIPFLADIERAAAQQFLPYLDWLEISVDLLEGLTNMGFLLKAQADRRLWVADLTDSAIDLTADSAKGSTKGSTTDSARNLALSPVVGFVVVKHLLASCFIVELDVHPDYGRLGIGSALVNACCQGAQQRNFDQVLLTTFRKVPWNIPFYQRLGFEVLPEQIWASEIRAIVEYETRYGFAPEKRAVMRRYLLREEAPS